MTMGELAKMFNAEKRSAPISPVVPMQDWQRGDWLDSTNLAWINPSPNMRSLNAAMLYPGIGMLEYAKISVGRGTDTPFEHVGADFIGGRELARVSQSAADPGHTRLPHEFYAQRFGVQGGQSGRRALRHHES